MIKINDFLSKFNLQLSRVYLSEIQEDVFLKDIDRKGPYSFFLNRNLLYYKNLISIGFNFYFSSEEIVIGEFDSIKMYVQTVEDLFILNEIYYEGIYNFSIPEDCIVLDIGMNVGFSSLFFARSPSIKKIVSFEPVYDTYLQALKNLELNPDLKSKIEVYNLGIGGCAGETEFLYSKEWKGSVGIRGLDESKKQSSKELDLINVKIEDISKIIISTESFNLPIVAKIDCEGAEYEIIDRLKEINKINSIKAYLIEWHDKGPSVINDILTQSGFFTISFFPLQNKNVGMLYASKFSTFI